MNVSTTDPSTDASATEADPPPPDPQQVPAGWYFDGVGQRWWDGDAWGPSAPVTVDSNDNTLAAVSHLGFLAGGFILPLALYASSDDTKRPTTRHNAREALNFQLTLILFQFAVIGVAMIVVFAGAIIGAPADPGDSGLGFSVGIGIFFLLIPLIFVLLIGSVVLGVIAAVKAGRGERYRYPICIRFLRS